MKNTWSISSMLDKLSATAMKCLSVTRMLSKTHLESTLQNSKTCIPRYSHGEYFQLLIESNLPVPICICDWIHSTYCGSSSTEATDSFRKGKEASSYLLFMDDLQLYSSSENDIGSLLRSGKFVSGEWYRN